MRFRFKILTFLFVVCVALGVLGCGKDDGGSSTAATNLPVTIAP